MIDRVERRDDSGRSARPVGHRDPETPIPEGSPLRPGLCVTLVLAVVLGGIAGFLVSGAAYLVLDPLLEESGTRLEEFQGLLWNLVPLGTLAGLIAGGVLLVRWRRRRR